MLIYPATDLSVLRDPDVTGAYLGPDAASKALDPRVSPALAATCAGVAPAIIGVGIYEMLYQDTLAFAARLRRDGVPVILREYSTLNHGFFSYTAISEASKQAEIELCGDTRGLLHPA